MHLRYDVLALPMHLKEKGDHTNHPQARAALLAFLFAVVAVSTLLAMVALARAKGAISTRMIEAQSDLLAKPCPTARFAHGHILADLSSARAVLQGRSRLGSSALVAKASVNEDAEFDLRPGISYLPALDFEQKTSQKPLEPDAHVLVLPCVPVPTLTYLPGTQPSFTIFEPRYRQMYSDIIMSGGRIFVAPYGTKDEATGQFKLAEVGAVFYLRDLKDVSEETYDEIKYICTHSVVGLVRIKRVLNPHAFADKSTYLRVEVEKMQDTDLGINSTSLEKHVECLVTEVARLQKETSSPLKLREDDLVGLNATRGFGFWRMLSGWQIFLYSRMQRLKQQHDSDLEDKIVSFLKETGEEVPEHIDLDSWPGPIHSDITRMKEEFQEELGSLLDQHTSRVQEILQTASHRQRLIMFEALVQVEERRLRALLALKSALKL
eukprot:gnl/TRDRNA2_/TRDRNA2_40361_c0_seq1.p1 gnl/TRDRNA2_/TRDRNA2_40361_c0~~gnl/TRDRNA2_/TRDRNA2_40361_c0_seq1.p1  ORF type:complete len:436 (-),score=73.39 gnl/TRDRNA2_/TRDRNA2_40361_c0_seq1:277-1584(-)